MRDETPGRWSSVGLLIVEPSHPGGGARAGTVGRLVFDSTHRLFASDSERAAGDFMWEVSSALLFLGVGGIGWAIQILIVGPTKK